MSKAATEALEDLHGSLALALKQRIASGEATAADLAVARQFLKDNGVDAIPRKGTPLGDLVGALPFAPGAETADGEQEYH